METLAQRITRDGALNELDAVGWIIRLAKRLEALHSLGVAHGTVSPACVATAAVDRTSRAAMTDMRRTPDDADYHSPERIAGGSGAISPADDTWALAGTLYFTLTGTPPFGTGDEARQKIAAGTPTLLAVLDIGDDDLQRVLDDAFSHEPGHRTTSVNVLRRELEKWHPDPSAKQLPPLEDEDIDDGDEDDDARTVMRDTYDEESDPPPPPAGKKPAPALIDDEETDERTVMRAVHVPPTVARAAPTTGRAPAPRPAAGMPAPQAPRAPGAPALPPRPVAGGPPRPAAGAPLPPRSAAGMPAPLAPPPVGPPRPRLESGARRSTPDRAPQPQPQAFRAPAAPVRGPIIDDDSDDEPDERTVMRASFAGLVSPIADDDTDERTVMRDVLPEASASRPGAPPPAGGTPFLPAPLALAPPPSQPMMRVDPSPEWESPLDKTTALPMEGFGVPPQSSPHAAPMGGLLGPSPAFEMQSRPMSAPQPFAMPMAVAAPQAIAPQATAIAAPKSRAGLIAIAVLLLFALGGAVFWFLKLRHAGSF